MGSRRQGREAALQMLYQADLAGTDAETTIRRFWAHVSDSGEENPFANRLVRTFFEQRERIDATIRKRSHHWRVERMASVDRNILRLATVELVACSDIPSRVTLNEAVELAKRFGSEHSAGFINGVLDGIASEIS